jgi:rSAM/selenodomain-associated transferase 1
MTDGCLIVFVKVPEEGKVKTRLARTIGDEAACALYRCFVADTVALARQTEFDTKVFFYPPEQVEAAADWLGKDVALMPQSGRDLGERMAAAFLEVFHDYRYVVLIGSDVPDLPSKIVDETFTGLRTHDAVIGPAGDGGYYLIGFSADRFTTAPFEGIEWGEPGVFERTVDILMTCGLKVHVLPQWNDIDDFDDLKVFFDAQRNAVRCTFSTVDFLRDHLAW